MRTLADARLANGVASAEMGIAGAGIEPHGAFGPRSRRAFTRVRALTWIAASLVGCASDLVAVGQDGATGFRHQSLGYSIRAPSAAEGGTWRRVSVEGTDLAFARRADDGEATMTLLSTCRRSQAPPAVRARNLLIGLPEHTLRQSGPVELDGDDGWSQVFDLEQGGVPVRVKAVTLVSGGCTFDWVLVAPGPFGGAEDSFDAWWTSFERGGVPHSALAHRAALR